MEQGALRIFKDGSAGNWDKEAYQKLTEVRGRSPTLHWGGSCQSDPVPCGICI